MAVLIFNQTGHNHFKEGGFITFVSALQLLIIARLAFSIFRLREESPEGSVWKKPAVIWKIIGIGFLFLAADEVFKIHEHLDDLIHFVFSMEETALSDRIDDIIVGLYGLVSIGLLVAYRAEVKTCVEHFSLFILGFVFLFIMVAFDIASNSNRNDIIPYLFEPDHAAMLRRFVFYAEDSFKIFAEAMFLLGFYLARQKARHMSEKPVNF